MQCAKCSHQWHEKPAHNQIAKTAPLAPKTTMPEISTSRWYPLRGWLILFAAAVIALVVGISVFLFSTSNTMPTAPGSYAPVDHYKPTTTPTGLVISNIEREVVDDGKVTLLIFTGEVTNTNSITTPVPEIRLQLLDEKGVELDFWPADMDVTELMPEETATWTVRFLNPPLDKIFEYRAFFRELQ